MSKQLPFAPSGAGGPKTIQTFASEEDRTRLTPTAIEAVAKVAEAWQLKGSEAAALLGISDSTWDRVKAGTWKQSLSQDQLMRASAMIGIFRGLHLLFADEMADRWPRMPNKGPLFENRSPVGAMIEDGIPLMLNVRRHVDALRGGL